MAGARHGTDDSRGAGDAVTDDEDVVAYLVVVLRLEAETIEQRARGPVAYGHHEEVAADHEGLAGVDGATSATLVLLAEDHARERERAVAEVDRGGQEVEGHSIGQCGLVLLPVGRHLLAAPPVDDGYCASGAHCGAGRIHGGVSAAHDDDARRGAHRLAGLEALEVARGVDTRSLPCDPRLDGLLGAKGVEDPVVALILEGLEAERGRIDAEDHLDAIGGDEVHIALDDLVRDAEVGDDVRDDATGLLLPLEKGHIVACTGQEEACRESCGTGADDGGAHLARLLWS